MFHNARICFAICTPMAKVTGPSGHLMYDSICPEWHRARMGMSIPTNINMFEVIADGMEVGDARSKAAAQVLGHKPVPEFLFFLDSDVVIPHDAFTKLLYNARCHPEYDIYAGVYVCKTNPPDPLIYGDHGMGAIWDFAVGDLLMGDKVKSCHMGLTLIRSSIFQKLKDQGLVHGDGTDQEDEPFFKTINDSQVVNGQRLLRRGTEDIYFCDKVIKAGGKIFVNTGVLAAHYDRHTGTMFGLPVDKSNNPFRRAKWMKDDNGETQDRNDAKEKIYEGPCECVRPLAPDATEFPEEYVQLDNNTLCVEKCKDCKGTGKVTRPFRIALDIGAGGTRKEWPGYTTYTTDIRGDTKPDYIQDSRDLTLPHDHFDLVASSHHLEHLGRWEQEKVWGEIFKITKPGGKIEHVVPNVHWAAAKIMSDELDEHAMNVLYGAQEAHGYERIYNTHFFGYTHIIGKALAESVGFVDVTTEDWRQNPHLGYNLIIRGRKPLPDEKPMIESGKKKQVKRKPEPKVKSKPAKKPVVTSRNPTPARSRKV